MQVKTFGADTIVAQIHTAVKAANDRNEIIFGVDVTSAEYAQLKKELEHEGDITHVPPSSVPLYVDGKSMTEEIMNRARNMRLLKSLDTATAKGN